MLCAELFFAHETINRSSYLHLVSRWISVCRRASGPSRHQSPFSITVGGLASAFQPDYDAEYNGNWAEAGPYRLYGFGAYTDLRFSRWVQIEGEARWLRFNQFDSIYQDNYLIGPRLPIQKLHFWRATPYAKALIGLANINLSYVYAGDGAFVDLGPTSSPTLPSAAALISN